ncbi:hypothetical protein [Chryseobacterium sp. WX]|uniref:hypothetical protein n=1 Tax=Chryseobacterium sp. WX TaxID=3031803 RepID=UPI00240989DE|nr:hypothetical protein [Chryseobacterium sp. WX]WFB66858.1 hypothetical protein PZ898_19310 [Chryseobacterium sp. WX]
MINWLSDKFKNSIDPKFLFEESVKCYKIEAFRASLLFSYLGFFTYIKEMIISSNKPTPIAQSRWDDIISKLNKDDYWEQRVYDELVNSTSSIFNFNDSIRQQIKYWKDRRNDCAHFRDNEINHHHVEMFWFFLKSNITKISIQGSKENLLEKFKAFFDKTKTPPNRNPDYLIYEIEEAVEYADLQIFYDQLNNITIVGESFVDDNEKQQIFYRIFSIINNARIKSELVSFIKMKPQHYDLKFILEFPTSLNFLNYNAEQIRNIWKTRVWLLNHKKYNLLVTLFRNGKIPVDERKEFFSEIFQHFNQIGYNNLYLDDQSKDTLFNNIYFQEVVEKELFIDEKIHTSEYLYINSKEELITLLFFYGDINEAMVEGLKKMVENGIRPYWLQDSLTTLFNENENKKNKILEIAATLNCEQSFYDYFQLN